MRICLVLAALMAIGVSSSADAQDIGKMCTAEADARGLRGQARVAFRSQCMAKARFAYRDHGWAYESAYCVSPVDNVGNVLFGSCPACVLVYSLLQGDDCFRR